MKEKALFTSRLSLSKERNPEASLRGDEGAGDDILKALKVPYESIPLRQGKVKDLVQMYHKQTKQKGSSSSEPSSMASS